jgi:hypothetical protein
MGRGRIAWLELIKKRGALGVIAWKAIVNCRESSMGLSIYDRASLVSYFTIRVCFAFIALLCIMTQVCKGIQHGGCCVVSVDALCMQRVKRSRPQLPKLIPLCISALIV